jgi:hypothetical protein
MEIPATDLTDDELISALLKVTSAADPRAFTVEERYGIVYEATLRLRRYVALAKAAAS